MHMHTWHDVTYMLRRWCHISRRGAIYGAKHALAQKARSWGQQTEMRHWMNRWMCVCLQAARQWQTCSCWSCACQHRRCWNRNGSSFQHRAVFFGGRSFSQTRCRNVCRAKTWRHVCRWRVAPQLTFIYCHDGTCCRVMPIYICIYICIIYMCIYKNVYINT